MSSNYEDVGNFHEKFNLPTSFEPWIRDWDPELIEFRIRFMQEELDEFKEGVESINDAKMADALIDLVYVALGTAHLLGYPWQELWEDVQRANMTKVRAQSDGSDSKRGSGWDVVKPEGWVGPSTWEILEKYGF